LVPTILSYENVSYSWAPNTPPPGLFGPLQRQFDEFVDPLLEALWTPWRIGDMKAVRQVWQQYINKYSTQSWYEGVQQGTGWDQAQMNAFGALGLGSGGFGPLYDIGFLDIFRLLVNQLETDQQLFQQGISGLTMACITSSSPMLRASRPHWQT
jgi:tryptophan 2-monooxygenase